MRTKHGKQEHGGVRAFARVKRLDRCWLKERPAKAPNRYRTQKMAHRSMHVFICRFLDLARDNGRTRGCDLKHRPLTPNTINQQSDRRLHVLPLARKHARVCTVIWGYVDCLRVLHPAGQNVTLMQRHYNCTTTTRTAAAAAAVVFFLSCWFRFRRSSLGEPIDLSTTASGHVACWLIDTADTGTCSASSQPGSLALNCGRAIIKRPDQPPSNGPLDTP